MFPIDYLFIIRRQFTVHAVYSIYHKSTLTSSTLIVLAASQRGCMIIAIDCIYSKLPPEDE